MAEARREWAAWGGEYLGEISALCFLHLSPHSSSLPYLLAGTGSEILVFDLKLGRVLRSFNVFHGIRVHGISCSTANCTPADSSPSTVTFSMAVYGDRSVKLFSLILNIPSRSEGPLDPLIDLNLLQSLPKFSQWVLDVSFLKAGRASNGTSDDCLAVGCSDNSVHVWNISTSTMMLEVACPDKCLLYSMRLWGCEIEALRVASGTIFNEIVVWRITNTSSSKVDSCLSDFQPYMGSIISRLSGHQGSIFRISWSSDGSKLVSASDDRSARIWITHGAADGAKDSVSPFSSGLVLYGHNARVWDCYIFDSVIVTAGEDCTCRLWGLDGSELKIIKEHIGRGIWRCLFDPQCCLLVTAGFDSAIKVNQCHAFVSGNPRGCEEEMLEDNEVRKLCIPNSSGGTGLMDSRSEYVRCLQFASADTIYVATNQGYVYHTQLSDSGSVKWNELAQVGDGVQIICMDLFSRDMPKQSAGIEDWVAVGDGKGGVTVMKVVSEPGSPKVDVMINWSAEKERQLLEVYWCKSLGYGYLFTSDPRGHLKLWSLFLSEQISCQSFMDINDMYLVAEFESSLGARIMCLNASVEEKVLVCGDLRGNLLLFPLAESLFLGTSVQFGQKIPSRTYFKGAHGISTVSSISLTRFSSKLLEIRSTGGDGCICYLEYDKDQQILEFVGMKQVKELSLVQSIHDNDSSLDTANSCYAIGFSSVDFAVWNLLTESKVVQVRCGGWRRPHSYYLGCIPETKNCFAYVKDEIIYVHRHWIRDAEREILPRHLHLQFHGREIHSLSFISSQCQSKPVEHLNLCSMYWIATGCEDGTVRLSRYTPGIQNWITSKLLGEHVGGSAVRSLCFVSKVYLAGANESDSLNRKFSLNDSFEIMDKPILLISVGAKRVLTSWLLRNKDTYDESSADGTNDEKGLFRSSMQELSFKWLSTDMPLKCAQNVKKPHSSGKLVNVLEKTSRLESNISSESCVSENKRTERNISDDMEDNDWRYLAVTAFLVKLTNSRLTVCFVLIASSDATLTLRALVLPCRYWFDVAFLAPLSSPVLALRHVVIPSSGKRQSRNKYVGISGSTDGSIALWDLSEAVEDFMQRLSTLQLEDSSKFQKRPRTGRGSQGGRWWRSIDKSTAANRHVGGGEKALNGETPCNNGEVLDGSASSMEAKKNAESCVQEDGFPNQQASEISACKGREISPLHVFHNVHQSGVNCLFVSECQNPQTGLLCHVVSGGDDQALNCFKFELVPARIGSGLENYGDDRSSLSGNDSIMVRIVYQKRVASAHSSAVKGVWTDGRWVFSTGLDQRVRCWQIEDEQGEVTEHSQVIVSVPEPEALDAIPYGKRCYEVGIAGRGMQVVRFSASDGNM